MPLKLFGGKGQDADRARNDARPRAPTDSDVRGERLHELAVLSLFLHSAGTMEEMMALFLERSPRVTGALLTYPLLIDKRRNILIAEHLSSVDDPGLERASMAANENFADLELPLPLRSWHRSVMDGGEVVLCDLDQVLGAVLG